MDSLIRQGPEGSRSWAGKKAAPEIQQQAEHLLKRARVRVMRHPVFSTFSGVIACGNMIVTDEVLTAETDGWDVWFNPFLLVEFAKHGDQYVNFVVLHEALHKAFSHCIRGGWVERMQQKHPQRCAAAIDYFVNTALSTLDASSGQEAFIKVPWWAWQPTPDWKNLSTPEIFKKLETAPEFQQGGGDGEGPSFDVHLIKPGSKKDAVQRDSIIQKELNSGRITAQILQRAGGRGQGVDTSNALDSLLGRLTQARLSYVDTLREWLRTTNVAGNDYATWTRVNRRFLSNGCYMPGMAGEGGGTLVVAMDTSGSCWDEQADFASELQGLIEEMQPEKVYVLWVDSEVQQVDILDGRSLTEVEFLKPRGGGGTDMREVFYYLRKHKIATDAVVTFTDGYTPWPTAADVEGIPNVWVITGSSPVSPVGTTIRLTRN